MPPAGAADPDCLFCRIVASEVPADLVRQTERTIAFRDISPQAPTHVLVVPRAHYADIGQLCSQDGELALGLVGDAVAVAEQEGVVPTGYRLVVNTGAEGGQTVAHVHVHVLGGRGMRWPPG